MDERRVAILGAGTIGESLLRGLLSGGWREPGEIVATVRDEERARELAERHGIEVTLSNAEAVGAARLVVIAVKPQDFDTLLGEIGGVLTPEQTVLSVAAAIPTAAIEARIADGVPVVRAMPNRPATVHEGIHPVELREQVTSPGGTTIRAIRELERAGVRAAFLNAIQAAMERSRELAAGEE